MSTVPMVKMISTSLFWMMNYVVFPYVFFRENTCFLEKGFT